MKNFLIFFGVTVVTITSCKKETSKKTSETVETNTAVVGNDNVLNVDFSDKRYNDLYKHYIHIKNALVSSDKEQAKSGSEQIGTAFANLGVDQSLMDSVAAIIAAEDIEVQREEFSKLTGAITEILSKAHIKSGKIYKQYCPMAFNSKGAYWLSTKKEIRNPYFGDTMLKCGEVKEEIQ